jgi:hypothetical protein
MWNVGTNRSVNRTLTIELNCEKSYFKIIINFQSSKLLKILYLPHCRSKFFLKIASKKFHLSRTFSLVPRILKFL